MPQKDFTPTPEQQIALSMAYLAYSGEKIIYSDTPNASVPAIILKIINDTLPKISVLCDAEKNNQVDWEVVWGPSIYTFEDAILQDNMMFVAQQISAPCNYVVAIRGTNGLAMMDWIKEDFEVWRKEPWKLPVGSSAIGNPKISKATNTGLDALLNKMAPAQGLPSAGMNINDFLSGIANSGTTTNTPINITFTGHSLAGALAPTLALWFKQQQGIQNSWDPNNNAIISTIPFAGATPGNADFAAYFDQQLGSRSQRIWNTLDVVPHAWQEERLDEIPSLYQSAGIKTDEAFKLLLEAVKLTVRGYQQQATDTPCTWTIQPDKTTFASQAAVQHSDSYPMLLGVPELTTVIDDGSFFNQSSQKAINA